MMLSPVAVGWLVSRVLFWFEWASLTDEDKDRRIIDAMTRRKFFWNFEILLWVLFGAFAFWTYDNAPSLKVGLEYCAVAAVVLYVIAVISTACFWRVVRNRVAEEYYLNKQASQCSERGRDQVFRDAMVDLALLIGPKNAKGLEDPK
jgi:hypothetical protein